MKCYNHTEIDAVGQCMDCGRGLCADCVAKWEIPLCDNCQSMRGKAEKASLNRELMLYAGLAIAGVIFGVSLSGDILGSIKTFGLAFPIYAAGWKWLNHLTDKFSLLATPGGWLTYIVIKLIFSAIVGVFALPYRLFYIYKRKTEISNILQYGGISNE